MPRNTKKNKGRARPRLDSLSLSNSNSNSNNSPLDPNNLEREPLSIRIPPQHNNMSVLSPPYLARPIMLASPASPASPPTRLSLALPTPRLRSRTSLGPPPRAPVIVLPPPSNLAEEGIVADGSPMIPPPNVGYSREQRAALAELRETELEELVMAELARIESLSKKKKGGSRPVKPISLACSS